METPRISQLLPTIKCSNCGITVELRRLAEHICEEAPAMPEMPSQYRKPLKQDNNISTRSNRSPRSPRPFYDAPLSSDSGYSSNSNNYAPQKQSNNNNYAPLQPSTPTSSTFLNKYAAAKDPYNTQTSRDPPYAQVYDNDSYQTQTPKQFDSYDNRQNNNINNNRYPSTTSSSSSNSNDNYSYDGRDYPRTTNELRVRDRSPGNYDRSNNGKPNGYDSPYDRQPQISRKNAPDNQIDKLLNDLISEMDNTNICAYCDSKINSSPMWALDKAWHPHHLLCTSCQKPIDPNEGHVEKNGKVYCPRDYAENFLPKCRRCGLSVEKEAVSASDGKLQGKWHVECFNCHSCYKPFPDKSFYVFNNAPYCKRHYHKLNNSLCRQCDDPIEGPCAQTVEGWRYHPRCFVCINCAIPLTDIYYSFENQQYCETHILEIQRRRKIRAEKRMTIAVLPVQSVAILPKHSSLDTFLAASIQSHFVKKRATIEIKDDNPSTITIVTATKTEITTTVTNTVTTHHNAVIKKDDGNDSMNASDLYSSTFQSNASPSDDPAKHQDLINEERFMEEERTIHRVIVVLCSLGVSLFLVAIAIGILYLKVRKQQKLVKKAIQIHTPRSLSNNVEPSAPSVDKLESDEITLDDEILIEETSNLGYPTISCAPPAYTPSAPSIYSLPHVPIPEFDGTIRDIILYMGGNTYIASSSGTSMPRSTFIRMAALPSSVAFPPMNTDAWYTNSCYKPFPDKSFYVFNNAPYCKRHYHKLNNSLCRQCDDPIEGPCAQTVEGWRYHPRCFVCINCAIPLTDIYYSFENQQYCETHILEIQRR
ncbi:12993_t:CDS:10, partial [Entrophospora sp. SA101]